MNLNQRTFIPFKNKEFATPFAMNFLSPAFSSCSCTSKSGGYKVIAPFQIIGKIEELRVIAKFLEDIDCF